jgi:histidinol-phosphate aminotransferase
VEKVIKGFDGLVILDEAYNDFSGVPTMLSRLDAYPNLSVLHTFSKAWGLAAIRLGMAFASPEIIAILTKIKYPYNVNLLTQQEALYALDKYYRVERWITPLIEERKALMHHFGQLPCVEKVFPSDANFFLARVTDAVKIYQYLVSLGIIVRNRHTVALCGNCLRVTVGTPAESSQLIEALKNYKA